MKYLILVASIILTSASSIIAMEEDYQCMLNNIAKATHKHPSITLVNNTKIPLCMEIGDEYNGRIIKSRMFLYQNSQLTLSPYAHPFFLKKEYAQEGTTINLFTKRPEDKEENTQHIPLLIGGNSNIQFGDTVHINYDDNTLNITNHPKKSSKKIAKRNSLK